MFVQIIQVFPLISRDYTDRQGNRQQFLSKGLLVETGHGTLFVEGVQEIATQIEKLQLKEKDCCLLQIGSVARSYKTSSGEERYSNEVTIKRITIV